MTTSNTKKPKDDKNEIFKDMSISSLLEVATYFGVRDGDIPADATREQIIEILHAAKRQDIAVAQTVKAPDGKEFDCPPGHMVIKVTAKAPGHEWGAKTREIFFFAVNGQPVFGRRGVYVVIPDKYRSCWENAIRHEYTMDGEPSIGPDGTLQPPKLVKTEVMSEDVLVAHWNRDHEAERRAEEELHTSFAAMMKERNARRSLNAAVLTTFGG